MEPVDLLCSRNARPQKGGRGTARPSFLLAEAARSECAPSMRAVKDSLPAPFRAKWGKSIRRVSSDTRSKGQPGHSLGNELSKLGRVICIVERAASFHGLTLDISES